MERLLAATEADTVRTMLFGHEWSGAPHRVLRTAFVAEWAGGARPGGPAGRAGGRADPRRRAGAAGAAARSKRVIGDTLRARTDSGQATEVATAVRALDRMLALGRPESVRIA